MTPFLMYLLLFVSGTSVGSCFLTWMQQVYLHRTPERAFSSFPLTLLVVAILDTIVCTLAFKAMKPFNNVVKRVKANGAPPTNEERAEGLQCFKRINKITLIGITLGFIVGNGTIILIRCINGEYLIEAPRIIYALLQATLFGAVVALYAMYTLDTMEGKFRYYLDYHYININQQSSRIGRSIAVIATVVILFMCTNMSQVPYQLLYLQETAPVKDAFSWYLKNTLLVFFLSAVVCFEPILIILRGLRKRLHNNTRIIDSLAEQGDLSTRIKIVIADDFGILSSSINRLMHQLQKMIRSLKAENNTVSESAEMLFSAATSASKALMQMNATIQRITDEGLHQNKLVLDVDKDIFGLSSSASELGQQMLSQSAAMQQNSASITEMASNIHSVAEMTRKADELSVSLSETSDRGNVMIEEAIHAISEIQKASLEVQDIVKIIQSIASQTNLLSMNAAIEAAHAGEFGTGFAVVADEVRSLANSSSVSAKNIQTHIKDMVSKINSGVESITHAGEAFKQVSASVSENKQLIETISQAMEEQRNGAEETLKVTTQVATSLEKANELAQKQSSYADNVKHTMEIVVQSSESVKQAISEADVATENLKSSVEQVSSTVEKNRTAVQRMDEQMSVFKVE